MDTLHFIEDTRSLILVFYFLFFFFFFGGGGEGNDFTQNQKTNRFSDKKEERKDRKIYRSRCLDA